VAVKQPADGVARFVTSCCQAEYGELGPGAEVVDAFSASTVAKDDRRRTDIITKPLTTAGNPVKRFWGPLISEESCNKLLYKHVCHKMIQDSVLIIL
jgi:hypothetical protein